MEKLTPEELLKAIKDYDGEKLADATVYYERSSDIEGIGHAELVKAQGGSEGGGEYVERVYHFTDHDVYLKLIGCYTSYDGTNYDDNNWAIVLPKEKIITVYE